MLCVRFRGRSDKVRLVHVGGTLAGLECPPPAEKPAGEEVRMLRSNRLAMLEDLAGRVPSTSSSATGSR